MSKNLLINTNDMSIFEPRRYYQEYEGTFITVTDKSEDDTIDTSRFIEVTEIWGNTVQDEENLEDIQSIGELYVDEQGEPILDDLGREQYKIEIESCNKLNAITRGIVSYSGQIEEYKIDNFTIKTTGARITGAKSNSFFTQDFGCGLGEYFAVEFDGKLIEGNIDDALGVAVTSWLSFAEGFNGKLPIDGKFKAIFKSSTNPNNSRSANLNILTTSSVTVANKVTYEIKNFKMYKVDNFNDTHQSHKTTILLPCQLQKVGNVYDRLYWDSEKGKYVVEKHIDKIILTESNKYVLNSHKTNVSVYTLPLTSINGIVICDKYISEYSFSKDYEHIYADQNKLWIFSAFNTLDEFKNYMGEHNAIVYYRLKAPQLIETNITEKIQLPCYEEKTHIFVNSTVDATMKVLVPYKEII